MADSTRSLLVDEMYLCDSGAQYWDGTTDVTRTMHFGTHTHFQKVHTWALVYGLSRLMLMVVSMQPKCIVICFLMKESEMTERGLC